MQKFELEIYLDGCETEEEEIEACYEFIYEQLSCSGSGVYNIKHVKENE